ncbi:hypothetical protein [Trichothermofontia sp.]
MSHKLKRITAALAQSESQKHKRTAIILPPPPVAAIPTPPPEPVLPDTSLPPMISKPCSFEIQADTPVEMRSPEGSVTRTPPPAARPLPTDGPTEGSSASALTKPTAVPAFPVARPEMPKVPTLPKVATPEISRYLPGVDPDLVLNVLKEIQATMLQWRSELEQIMVNIQALYEEGPIIDGWLESVPPNAAEPVSLRHAEISDLIDYVEATANPQRAATYSHPSSRVAYRVCGLDESGKQWERPCPPEQVPAVSLAIARYQKLRQLINRKHLLEDRLSQFASTLVMVHSQIKQF